MVKGTSMVTKHCTEPLKTVANWQFGIDQYSQNVLFAVF